MTLGSSGENEAAKHLRRVGYRIVARNYRCRAGEIDLIAIDEGTIVFVEVKTRRQNQAADPEVNVTYHKRCRISRAAKHFLMEKSAQGRPCRFDVVSVLMPEQGKPVIEHFADAFAPTPR